MGDFITILIFLGITFTLVGSVGSIIILCMYFLSHLNQLLEARKNKNKNKNNIITLNIDSGSDSDAEYAML